jgi:hypothetical protein
VKIEGFERKSTSTLETKKDQRERERERERERGLSMREKVKKERKKWWNAESFDCSVRSSKVNLASCMK